jgi:hypothetical protein
VLGGRCRDVVFGVRVAGCRSRVPGVSVAGWGGRGGGALSGPRGGRLRVHRITPAVCVPGVGAGLGGSGPRSRRPCWGSSPPASTAAATSAQRSRRCSSTAWPAGVAGRLARARRLGVGGAADDPAARRGDRLGGGLTVYAAHAVPKVRSSPGPGRSWWRRWSSRDRADGGRGGPGQGRPVLTSTARPHVAAPPPHARRPGPASTARTHARPRLTPAGPAPRPPPGLTPTNPTSRPPPPGCPWCRPGCGSGPGARTRPTASSPTPHPAAGSASS